MDEGVFGRWLKQEGEAVAEGDALFELESDKATQEVESFEAGILRLPPDAPAPGDAVKVGQILGYLCTANEPDPWQARSGSPSAVPPAASRPAAAVPPAAAGPASPAASAAPAAPRGSGGDDAHFAPPSVRRLARELHVDLRTIHASGRNGVISADDVRAAGASDGPSSDGPSGDGPSGDGPSGDGPSRDGRPSGGLPRRVSPRAARRAAELQVDLSRVVGGGALGRVRERDVVAAARRSSAASAPAAAAVLGRSSPGLGAAPERATAPTTLRRTIAARMLAAAQQTAAVTLTAEVDVTALVAIRRQLQQLRAASDDPAPGYTAMFVKLAGAALAVHPGLTQQWTEHGLLTPDGMHVNVAVDAPQGLVTPLVRDVSELSLVEIGRQIRELAALARTRRLTPEQLQPGAFTVTNLGGYAVDAFTPLLNLPQAAILGVGRIREAPLVRDGAVVAGYAAALSLTFDHRVVDGAPAAELLTTLAAMAEAPLTVLLD